MDNGLFSMRFFLLARFQATRWAAEQNLAGWPGLGSIWVLQNRQFILLRMGRGKESDGVLMEGLEGGLAVWFKWERERLVGEWVEAVLIFWFVEADGDVVGIIEEDDGNGVIVVAIVIDAEGGVHGRER